MMRRTRLKRMLLLQLGTLLALGGCSIVSDFGDYEFSEDAGSAGSGGTGGSSGSGGGDSGTGGSSGAGGSSGEGGSSGAGGTSGMDGGGAGGMDAGADTGDGGPSCGTVTICDDGKDRDGTGESDCPQLRDEFPGAMRATSAADVEIALEIPTTVGASLECRSGKPGEIDCKDFMPCGAVSGAAYVVRPHSEASSQDAAFDGVTTTQVRVDYGDGTTSEVLSRTYYIHHSLHGVSHCADDATDAAYFQKAAEYLDPSGGQPAFAPSDVRLSNPFIEVQFDPRVDNIFQVSDADGSFQALSLRRRFVLDSTRRMLLITRVYDGRRTSTCKAGSVRVHATAEAGMAYDPARNYNHLCDAFVLNKRGAGVCLTVNAGTVELARRPTECGSDLCALRSSSVDYFLGADNFLWRKLMKRNTDGSRRLFSQKCFSDPSCADQETLYLPDREWFAP